MGLSAFGIRPVVDGGNQIEKLGPRFGLEIPREGKDKAKRDSDPGWPCKSEFGAVGRVHAGYRLY